MSGIIASEFVSHQPTGFSHLAINEKAEKAFCRPPMAEALHQNINNIVVLVNCTLEIIALGLNGDKAFVDVPGIP